MEINEDRAKEKKEEILEIIQININDYVLKDQQKISNNKINEISEEIFNNFVKITPPKNENMIYFITMKPGGINGGTSTKPGNIILNWKKLLVGGSESILTAAGIVAIPWLIPLGALIIWNRIWSMSKIKITEKHAMVLWTLWESCDKNHKINNDVILNLINKELKNYNRNQMNKNELIIILNDLERMKCIKRKDNNQWWLREWIKVVYQ